MSSQPSTTMGVPMCSASWPSSYERAKGSSVPVLSRGPIIAKASPSLWKECRSSSTSWRAMTGARRLVMRAS
jgi:hypothetical protein